MKKYIKKLISIPPILAISISLLTACSVPQSESTPSPSEKSANETVYAFVGKDIQNPYNQKVFEGFETACNEIGIEAVYKAPTSATADKDNASEIILGDPIMFDRTNIDSLSDIY